jgi:DNA modification methylase
MAAPRSRSATKTAATPVRRQKDSPPRGLLAAPGEFPHETPQGNPHRRRPRGAQPFALRPDPRNANAGTPRGRAFLERSFRDYGAGRSAVADATGTLLAGNKAFAAAQALNLPIKIVETTGGEFVVVVRRDLTLGADPRAQALAIADNRSSELDLEWDPEVLAGLKAEGFDLDGFWTIEEFEQLLGHGVHAGHTDEDAVLAPPTSTDIRVGDLFQLGSHRLLCGDATRAADVARVLDGAIPVLLNTDAPYGVSYDPAWRHALAPTQRTAVGTVMNDHRADWSAAFCLFPGDVIYAWHGGLLAATVADALARADFDLRSQIVWRKQHFAMSRGCYHWIHESAWYAVRRGRTAHWHGDRTQTTVWDVPNLNPMGGTRTGENTPTGHSTQKPVALFERPILNHTTTADAVMDMFVGSGTAIIAAEKTGRRCYAMELDPIYVQLTIGRWEAFTKKRATRLGRTSTRDRRTR